jgi:hypothetical protein
MFSISTPVKGFLLSISKTSPRIVCAITGRQTKLSKNRKSVALAGILAAKLQFSPHLPQLFLLKKPEASTKFHRPIHHHIFKAYICRENGLNYHLVATFES